MRHARFILHFVVKKPCLRAFNAFSEQIIPGFLARRASDFFVGGVATTDCQRESREALFVFAFKKVQGRNARHGG